MAFHRQPPTTDHVQHAAASWPRRRQILTKFLNDFHADVEEKALQGWQDIGRYKRVIREVSCASDVSLSDKVKTCRGD